MTALARELHAIISAEGPISVARFMALALGHPEHGYYTTREPFGAAGDFTTAPEISQMFGELLGLWTAEVWHAMGRPAALRLVELGPGRGTLMADLCRAARALPAFREALQLHLVELSPRLRALQRERLGDTAPPITWHERIEDVPDGPAVILANEFFDALPVRQFVKRSRGWHERLVGLGPTDDLAFGLAPEPEPGLPSAGPEGAVLELAEVGLAIVAQVADRLARCGGVMLAIDYGHVRTGFGDTLQAVRAHRFADPLDGPGEADLTAHVDFDALGRAARARGASVQGPTGQGDFLRALGIEARASRLAAGADAAQAEAVEVALARLTGSGEGRMGELFKVLAVAAPGTPPLPGFPASDAANSPHAEHAPC